VAVILLVIVLAVMLSQQQITQEPDPEPTLAPTVELDPLRQEINQLRAELEAADPTTQELPFPPVNLNIYLDQQR
jgi:hypothetical protein